MNPCLSSLIGSENFEMFLGEHWLQNPFVLHDLNFEAMGIMDSTETFLQSWPGRVQAHLPDVADEASSIDASSVEAQKHFANGMGLLFNNVEAALPNLKPWIHGIRSELGLPRMTYGRCIVYATPDGKGTAAHFDQNINFVLQLRGTKIWKLAPNMHVIHPTVRHTLGLPMDPELAGYSEPIPVSIDEVMPKDKTIDVVLKPGSLLFVPRGYWHSTSAIGDALALNFTFTQPTWADLFLAALKSRLNLSAEWRELAGVASPDANLRLDDLLLELVHDLPNWQAADILRSTEGEP